MQIVPEQVIPASIIFNSNEMELLRMYAHEKGFVKVIGTNTWNKQWDTLGSQFEMGEIKKKIDKNTFKSHYEVKLPLTIGKTGGAYRWTPLKEITDYFISKGLFNNKLYEVSNKE